MKQKKYLKMFITIFFVFTLILSTFQITVYADEETTLSLSSNAVLLFENGSDTLLYSKNPEKKMFPASTTKIMTAILGIENGNLDDIVTVNQSAVSIIPNGYSSAYLVNGEKISLENLLKMLLVHSANDSANVIAEHISGSIDNFVELMNSKAKSLGCTNTNFVNTNGIQNENHYTTAKDLSIIAKYCMKNETFRKIVSNSSCTIPATNKSPKRTYYSTNESLLENSNYYRSDCIGIKTGFTTQAGYCIISSVKKGDVELIAVILSSPKEEDRYSDLNTLFDYGYTKYSKILIEKQEEEKRLREEEQRRIAEEQKRQEELKRLEEKRQKEIEDLKIKTLIALAIIIFFIIVIIIILLIIKKKEKDKKDAYSDYMDDFLNNNEDRKIEKSDEDDIIENGIDKDEFDDENDFDDNNDDDVDDYDENEIDEEDEK